MQALWRLVQQRQQELGDAGDVQRPGRDRVRKADVREAFRRRRCITPASGFFEWTGEKGDKTPHLFLAADGSPVLAFAGLWERWRNPEGDEVLSATVIVSGASEWMIPYHDRMPVLLSGADIDGWLDGTLGQEGLKPAAASALREWTVSKRVNRTGVGDDDPTIVEPAAA